jgi:hypothetical protein
MATIKINNLNTAGSDLFSDSESYLTELTEEETNLTQGGLLTRYISSFFCRITARYW